MGLLGCCVSQAECPVTFTVAVKSFQMSQHRVLHEAWAEQMCQPTEVLLIMLLCLMLNRHNQAHEHVLPKIGTRVTSKQYIVLSKADLLLYGHTALSIFCGSREEQARREMVDRQTPQSLLQIDHTGLFN